MFFIWFVLNIKFTNGKKQGIIKKSHRMIAERNNVKASSLLSQETPLCFENNVNFIKSSDIDNLISLQLTLISNYINEKKNSYIFSFNQEECKELVLKLLAIRMNCSLRNIKNETFISPRKSQYEEELSLIDKYVVFVNEFNDLDLDKGLKDRKLMEGSNWFFLNVNDALLSRYKRFFTSDFCVQDLTIKTKTMFRFCLKTSKVLDVKIFMGMVSDDFNPSEIDLYSFPDVSRSVYFLNKNNLLIDLNNDYGKKFFLIKSNEKNEFDLNKKNEYSNNMVDPSTGLFHKLQDKDVLILKDLLITLSRNKNTNLEQNKYFNQWISCYKNKKTMNSDSDVLCFMSKVYLSIVNKLELKKNDN